MEKGNGVSPYGKFLNEQSYIIIVAKDGGAYSFYINAKDSSGHKIYNMPSSKIDSNIISTSSDVAAMIDAGATRIGTSSSIQILKEFEEENA